MASVLSTADLIVRNATIIDGSGSPRYPGDIAITGDRVSAIGRLDRSTAAAEIDASGLVVCPGLIDLLKGESLA